MGRGLTLLVATALAAALAMPFLVLLSLFFFGVPSTVYLFVTWLGGEAIVILATGFLLRRGARNEAYVGLARVSDESQETPQFSNDREGVFSEAS
jgi:hypothetical protein